VSSGGTAASGDYTIKVWDASSGKLRFVLQREDAWARALAFSEDGRAFASGDHDGSVCVWDSRTGKEILCGKGESARDGDRGGAIAALALSANGQSVAWTHDKGGLGFIDLKSGKRKQLYQAPAGSTPGIPVQRFVPAELRMTRDTKLVICLVGDRFEGDRFVPGRQERIVFLDPAAGQKVAELATRTASAIEIDPDEKVLAIGAGSRDAPVGIILLDVKTRREIKTIPKASGQSFGYNRMRFVDGGKAIIASLFRTGEPHRVWQVGVWRVSDGKELALYRWSDDTMRYFAFSGDGKVVATGHDDGKVKLWELPWSY
jgi:WD40 repeat protein